MSFMKKLTFFSLIGLLFLSTIISCSDDDEDIDEREQYVGSWNVNEVGSITLFQNGSSIGTVPIDTTFSISITKSGDNGLNMDGTVYFINGNSLSTDPESITETSDGINIVGTQTSSGTLSTDVITLRNDITGTWSASSGDNGNLSGSSTATLTR